MTLEPQAAGAAITLGASVFTALQLLFWSMGGFCGGAA